MNANQLRILLVDDDAEDCLIVRDLLAESKEARHHLEVVSTFEAGLDAMESQAHDVYLIDYLLGDRDGLELLRHERVDSSTVPMILLTGQGNREIDLEAMRIGAADYLVKGQLTSDLLERSIRYALERKRAERALRESVEELQRTIEGTVKAMASVVEIRDPYTAGHQERVAHLASAVAREMGLSKQQILVIRLAATVHDVGKMAVPAEILCKPGRISENELNLFKRHPQVACDILDPIGFPWPIARIALQHHERLNGSGYPFGLTNGEILLEARIIAVADVVEAMSSHRPYRPALGLDSALDEISRNIGKLYDSGAVTACLRLFTEKGYELHEA